MFKEYQSKPVTRKAMEVTEKTQIVNSEKEATASVLTRGGWLEFKHYEPVEVGDFIVYLKDDDVYHCRRDVFLERNIVPSE